MNGHTPGIRPHEMSVVTWNKYVAMESAPVLYDCECPRCMDFRDGVELVESAPVLEEKHKPAKAERVPIDTSSWNQSTILELDPKQAVNELFYAATTKDEFVEISTRFGMAKTAEYAAKQDFTSANPGILRMRIGNVARAELKGKHHV